MLRTFNNGTGLNIGAWYIVLIGLLLAQYTFTGYDASAHLTEETHRAARSGPRGIVMSILVSLFAGWVLLIGITFAIQANYTTECGGLRRARADLRRRDRPAPAASCCCWWRSGPSCSAGCPR